MSDFGGKVKSENFDGSEMHRLFRLKSVEGHTTRRALQLKISSCSFVSCIVFSFILALVSSACTHIWIYALSVLHCCTFVS